jgi:cell pole-organizing protein PopZ
MSGVFSRRGAQPPPPPPKPAAPPEADPSMEDILASIRRILNEGEGEAAPAEAAAAPEAAEPVAAPPAPVPEAPAQASVANPAPVTESGSVTPEKETQSASTTGNEPVEGEDVFILDTAMMVADTAVAEAPAEAPIASTETMAAASQSVGALKKALSERQAQVYKQHAVSLEEIVREEVRPMLKGWLDTHLPAIVERLVRAEIERVVAREML